MKKKAKKKYGKAKRTALAVSRSTSGSKRPSSRSSRSGSGLSRMKAIKPPAGR